MVHNTVIINSVSDLMRTVSHGLDNYEYDEQRKLQIERIKQEWANRVINFQSIERAEIKTLRDNLSATTNDMEPAVSKSTIQDALLFFVDIDKLSKQDATFCTAFVRVAVNRAVDEDRKEYPDPDVVLDHLYQAMSVVDKTSGGYPEMKVFLKGMNCPQSADSAPVRAVNYAFAKLNKHREDLAEHAITCVLAIDELYPNFPSKILPEHAVLHRARTNPLSLHSLLVTPSIIHPKDFVP